MYQLLTGTLPFQASNNFSMMYQITNVEPVLPSSLRKDIPLSVDKIVRRAMQKDLERRYPGWEEFSYDLAEAFRTEQLTEQSQEVADSEKFNTLRAMPFFELFTDAELWEVLRISAWENLPPEGDQEGKAAQPPARGRVLRRDGLPVQVSAGARRRRLRHGRRQDHLGACAQPGRRLRQLPPQVRPRLHGDPGRAPDDGEHPAFRRPGVR